MKRLTKQAFTLIELLVVISIIALLIGILLPALGAARRTARQMQNSTQLRGIQQSMVMFAQGNNTYFPGIQSNGTVLVTASEIGENEDQPGDFPEARVHILFKGNYFTGEYAISPGETKQAWTTGNVESNNFSYAMLKLDSQSGKLKDDVERGDEWRNTLNTEAAVLSDRNKGSNATDKVSSLWTAQDSGQWHGSVVWNDNHVVFESTSHLDTRYGNQTPNEGDNLFAGNDVNAGEFANAGMVYQDNNAYVDQD